MGYIETGVNPKYQNAIRRLETSDPVHAGIFNAVFQQLLDNDGAIQNSINGIVLTAENIPVSSIEGLEARNVQEALIQLFQFTKNGKKEIIKIIGSIAEESNSFSELAEKIQQRLKEKDEESLNGRREVAESIEEMGVKIRENPTFEDLKLGVKAITPRLNVFVQKEQPEGAEGLWIETEASYDHVISDIQPYVAGEWLNREYGLYQDLPFSFYGRTAAAIDNCIYIFGNNNDDSKAYKYDIKDCIYSDIAKYPISSSRGSAVSIGSDVYVFGTSWSSGGFDHKHAYKYDSITNTYTRLKDIPNGFYSGSACVIDSNIYIMGGTNNKAYKYDFRNGTYTLLKALPYTYYGGALAAVGDNLYLMGGSNSSTQDDSMLNFYQYNIISDTYTKLSNLPYRFVHGEAVAMGTDIYLFGGEYSNRKTMKYNILTRVFISIDSIKDHSFDQGAGVLVNNWYFLIGSKATSNSARLSVFTFQAKEYPEDSVVIHRTHLSLGNYNTAFISQKQMTGSYPSFSTGFNDAWLYKNGDLIQSLPTYYGDGENWLKFKN